jgi:hypothetical protein
MCAMDKLQKCLKHQRRCLLDVNSHFYMIENSDLIDTDSVNIAEYKHIYVRVCKINSVIIGYNCKLSMKWNVELIDVNSIKFDILST